MVQTRRDIQGLLDSAGISPLKRFGQNFLIDGNLMRKLVDAAGIRPTDVVLEVGPGTGALTEHLVSTAGHVVSVEIDRGLQGVCRRLFAERSNWTLVEGDVLASKSEVAPDVVNTVRERQGGLGGRILLVANLPYQVATPLVVGLMMGTLPVAEMCFTVQAEVGDRFAAGAGSKTYGPISIFAQVLGELTRIARVPPSAFWPAPTIDSVMLRWVRTEPAPLDAPATENLSELVHHCFNHRRKTLRSTLRTFLEPERFTRFDQSGQWDLNRRPEQLTPPEWVAFSAAVGGLE